MFFNKARELNLEALKWKLGTAAAAASKEPRPGKQQLAEARSVLWCKSNGLPDCFTPLLPERIWPGVCYLWLVLVKPASEWPQCQCICIGAVVAKGRCQAF